MKYYTGYDPQEDELSDEQDSKSSDEEFDQNEFKKYLKTNKTPFKKFDKKSQAAKFENEMEKELDNLIEKEIEKYDVAMSSSALLDQQYKSNQVHEYENSSTDSDQEEGEDSAKAKKTKPKKREFTNDDLFYDPDMDTEDENWMNEQRKTCKKMTVQKTEKTADEQFDVLRPSTSEPKKLETVYSSAKTDAILNCPCCMTLVCMDCQRHEKFKTQYRAMFVFNCKIKQDEQLKYPKGEGKSHKKYYKKKKQEENVEQEYEIFKPVSCENCNTEVGVYDEKEELYYFFNVLASHS